VVDNLSGLALTRYQKAAEQWQKNYTLRSGRKQKFIPNAPQFDAALRAYESYIWQPKKIPANLKNCGLIAIELSKANGLPPKINQAVLESIIWANQQYPEFLKILDPKTVVSQKQKTDQAKKTAKKKSGGGNIIDKLTDVVDPKNVVDDVKDVTKNVMITAAVIGGTILLIRYVQPQKRRAR